MECLLSGRDSNIIFQRGSFHSHQLFIKRIRLPKKLFLYLINLKNRYTYDEESNSKSNNYSSDMVYYYSLSRIIIKHYFNKLGFQNYRSYIYYNKKRPPRVRGIRQERGGQNRVVQGYEDEISRLQLPLKGGHDGHHAKARRTQSSVQSAT